MASKDIYLSPDGTRLVAGLEWRVLDAAASRDSGMRAMAKERTAAYAVSATASTPESVTVGTKTKEVRRVAGGFFTSVQEGARPGKKAHSLAAAFARWSREHAKAALFARTEAGGYAVVVVLNGLPALDKVVESDSEGYEIVVGYIKDHPEISIFADDIEKFPASLMGDGLLPAIAAAADKSTAIKPIPVNVGQLAAVVVMAGAVLAGYQWWTSVQEAEARSAALLRAQMADPVPKYLNALAEQRGSLGATRTALTAAYREAGRVPVTVEGWTLKGIECAFRAHCVATYERTTGTYEGLKSALGFMTLEQTASMNLNQAKMTWAQEMDADVVDIGKSPFDLATYLGGEAGSQYQDWMVAGLGLMVQAPALWPSIAEVPSGFKHPQAVALGRVEVSNVPLPLVEEVIAQAPLNVIWAGFDIQIGEARGADPLSQAKVKLSGSYYVQN